MPKPRFGTIPTTRLSQARKVRDALRKELGAEGYAVLSIANGGYSVCVRIYEGVRLNHNLPREMDGIPIKVTRIGEPNARNVQP